MNDGATRCQPGLIVNHRVAFLALTDTKFRSTWLFMGLCLRVSRRIPPINGVPPPC